MLSTASINPTDCENDIKEGVLVIDSAVADGGYPKKGGYKNSFANMITVIRLHLMSYAEFFDFI